MSLFPVGINSFFQGKGVQAVNAMPIVSIPGVYHPQAGLKPVPNCRFYEPVVNAALGSGDTQTILGASSGEYFLLKYLNVICDTTCQLQFFMGPVNYLPVNVTANVQKDVLLPCDGLISEADNQDFVVKNTAVGAVAITVTFSIVVVTMSPE